MAQERTCMRCREQKPLTYFAPAKSKFHPKGRSVICTQCLGQIIEQDNLDSVDSLCRYLDIPFDPNEWTRLYELNGNNTLQAYFNLLTDDKYDTQTWAMENERWRVARESGTIEEEIEILDKSELRRLQTKWSDAYTTKELKWLEEYYDEICGTQNVNTPILREYACDLCEIELQIKKGVRQGADVKKLMDARDNIIKMAAFEANNSKNVADFDSVGEVITYYVKKGWHPQWKQEPKDSYDFLMKNIQGYLTRLVTNEGNLLEQVEDKKARFEVTERLGSDESEKFEEVSAAPEGYEGEDELMLDLGGEEVE